ncbi:hypothetical protein Ahy_B10g103048 [Arachis hypogaea]|uniref:Uncharacterized protein n=1 Tax=Arachis hypogaea TaxID=3818 RepID=A0A444X344_ARAHY|nr:hypothetical protein Ahy_B10g103048 [Arachis hypogaea]
MALEKKDVEEELKEKIQEKEKEVLELRQKIKEIESFVNSKSSDMEEWVKEKLSLQEALKKSEEREKSLELFCCLIEGRNRVNGNGVIARDGKWVKGLNVQWPVVVIGSTVVAATVVIYLVNFDFLLKSWNTYWLLALSSEELKQNFVC